MTARKAEPRVNLTEWRAKLDRVSVVICTHSKQRGVEALLCVQSVRKQTLKPYEIILVLDNPDKNLRMFHASRIPSDVTMISSEGHGLGNARNTGIRKATGDIVAFIDDDATADRNWLENLIKSYENAQVVGVGGLVQAIWENGRPIWFPEELDWIVGCSYKGLPEHKSLLRNPIGCNMSFRRRVFEKAGYFRLKSRVDLTLLAADETEFSIRVLRRIPKARIIYEPSALTYHRVPISRKSFRYFVKRAFYEGLSKRILETVEPTSLSLERQYLRNLIGVSVLSRMRRIGQPKNLLQCLALVVSILVVGMGYFFGGFGSSEWAFAEHEKGTATA